MECFRTREALSALLDGEAPGADGAPAQAHLDDCAACARWQDDAADLDRRMRIAPAAVPEEPDLAARVLPNVRLPRPRRWPTVLRLALAGVALVQLGIAAANLAGPLGLHPAVSPSAHMDHEVTAFNLAFGVTLLVIAVNPHRASGHVPVLASFLLVLAAASAVDLSSGNVGWTRLATHAPIVLGLLLATGLTRAPATPPYPGNTPTRANTGATRAAGVEPESANHVASAPDVRSPPPPVAHQDHPTRRRSA